MILWQFFGYWLRRGEWGEEEGQERKKFIMHQQQKLCRRSVLARIQQGKAASTISSTSSE